MSSLSAQAIPCNFTRAKKGDALIAQEMQKLLEIDAAHHAARPLLTTEGRVRGKWEEIRARAPAFFSAKFDKVRNREAYGKAVHTFLVRLHAELSHEPHTRTDARFDCSTMLITFLGGMRELLERHELRDSCSSSGRLNLEPQGQ